MSMTTQRGRGRRASDVCGYCAGTLQLQASTAGLEPHGASRLFGSRYGRVDVGRPRGVGHEKNA
jgi:hypothetical protein